MKRYSSERIHEHARNRWDGIQQYFREQDHEKKEKMQENKSLMLKSAYSDPEFRSYHLTDNSDFSQQTQKITETDIYAKKRLILLSAIKHGKERLSKNENGESKVIHFKDQIRILKDKESETKAFTGIVADKVRNSWSGIQQYFHESGYEKKQKLETNVTSESSPTYFEGNELETKTSISGHILDNVGNRWSGIRQYFLDKEHEKKRKVEENDIKSSFSRNLAIRGDHFTGYSAPNQQSLEATGRCMHSKESMQVYDTKPREEKIEENIIMHTQEKIAYNGGNELVVELSIAKKLCEKAGNMWIRVHQYFGGNDHKNSKRAEENRLGESCRIYYGQRVSNCHSAGSSQIDPQFLETMEEEIYGKQYIYPQLTTVKHSVQETDGKKAVENTLECCSSIEIYSQNQRIWGTEDLTGSNLEGIWKVKCELLMTIANEYEFRWKVKLKLRPARKFISMQQLIPTSNKIQNLKNYEVSNVPRKYKIVFIGDSGVGKTSFIRRYCNNSFKSSFHSTVGVDFLEKKVNMNSESSVLQLWDTGGQERFRSMCVQYYRNSDAIIAIYDVTSEMSFKNIRGWIDNIRETTDSDRLTMLIGNKIDAIDFKLNNAVRTTQGALLAEEYGTLFFETSVKYDENVTEAMTELLRSLRKRIQQGRKKLILEKKKSEKKCC